MAEPKGRFLTSDEIIKIRRLRRENPGITSKEVALAIGRSQSAVAKWAADNSIPFEGKRGRGPSGPRSEAHKEAIRQGMLRRKANA